MLHGTTPMMSCNNSTDPSGTLKRDQRAKTQPQPQQPKETQNPITNSRRATYHINDGTQRSMDDDENYLASGTSNNTSMDSGLGSKRSSTLSIDNIINSTETSGATSRQFVTHDTGGPAQIRVILSNASDIEHDHDNIASVKGNGDLMERNLKRTDGTCSQDHEDSDTEECDSGSEDVRDYTGVTAYAGPLTTIHELGAESNDNVETEITNYVVHKIKAHDDTKKENYDTKKGNGRWNTVWHDLFGRCFRLRSPHPNKEKESNYAQKHFTNILSEELDQCPAPKPCGSLRRPDSGYDSFKIKEPPNEQRSSDEMNMNNTQTDSLTGNALAIQDLVEALQHFQNGQRMSDEALAGRSVQTDNFAATFLTNKGGRICLPIRNVNLYVPPGAIPSGKPPQLVYIYVSAPTASGQSLGDSDETWLTPSVHCGPSGLQFNKDVFLTMPHCAADIRQWEFTMHQVKRRKDGGEWRRLQENEDDAMMVVKQTERVTMLMNHFCGQKGSGKSTSRHADATPAAKRMNVTVSSKESLAAAGGGKISIEICITNKDEVSSLDKTLRQNLPDSYLNPSTESLKFIRADRFRDLCLSLDFLETGVGCSRGWTGVAGKLGDVSPAFVYTAQRQLQRSPSAILLDSFFKMKASEEQDVLDTLTCLSNVCEDIDSFDPKRIIDEEMSERVSMSSSRNQMVMPPRAERNRTSTQQDDYQEESILDSKELLVQCSGGDLVVQADGIRSGWNIEIPRKIIDFNDVWSRCNHSACSGTFNVVTIDAVAETDCRIGTPGSNFSCGIHVYQELSSSAGATFDVGKVNIKNHSEDNHISHEAAEEQPIQTSLYDLRDERLRHSLTSPQSKMAWTGLMRSTSICDEDEVVERLSKQSIGTTCPAALALDLFFALHDNNTQALEALESHERQNSEHMACVPSGIAEPCRSNHNKPLPAISLTNTRCMVVTTVVNKWKSWQSKFRRLGSQKRPTQHIEHVEPDINKTTQIYVFPNGNASNVECKLGIGIVNSGFQDPTPDIGIDNPAFHDTEVAPLNCATSANTTPSPPPSPDSSVKSHEDIDGELTIKHKPSQTIARSNDLISPDLDLNEFNETLDQDEYLPKRTVSMMSNDSGYVGTIEKDVLAKMSSITEDTTF